MERAWAWFHDPSMVLPLVKELDGDSRISLLVQDPEDHQDVMVVGPLSHDMACYPFLDIPHQIRRFGVRKSLAEHYTRVLYHGGAVICVEFSSQRTLKALLQTHHAHDVVI